MSCITGNNGNINETFIIEPLSITGGSPTLSACTSLYTNQIISCSGDTTITLGTGIIIFNGPISATSVNTSNYYSGGTNLLDIFSADTYVTGGTLSGNTLELFRNDNAQININLSDLRFSGGTGHCITDFYVTNIYGCSPITVHDHLIVLSGITLNLPVNDDTLTQVIVRDSISGELKYRNVQSILSGVTGDTFVTGGTPNNSAHTYTFTNNSGGTFTVNGLDDITITGGTYSAGTVTFINSTGGTFSVTGLSSTDTYVTGYTYGNNIFTIKQNQGQPDLSVLFNTVTGLTVNGNLTVTGNTTLNNLSVSALTATTISATTYLGLPLDIKVTGGTYNNPTGVATFTNNTGGTFNVTGFYTNANDIFVTGGTSNNSAHTYTFTNNTGGTFTVVGLTDITITGGTYSAGTATFSNNTGGTFSVSGFSTTDTFVTGYTYSNNLFTIARNQGQPNLTALINTMTGLTVNGNLTVTGNTIFNNLTATTISATTYLNLPIDIRVTGGTYSNGTAIFRNNTGGTFNVSGFFTGATDVFVTGGTTSRVLNNTTLLFKNNTGGTFTVTGITDVFVTGITINNATYDLTVGRNDGVNLTTNLGILSTDIKVTGGTYNINTGVVTFTNSTGGTFTVSGFTSGMTDTRVSSFTYNNANTFTIVDSTGGTFNASFNVVTGLTVNGNLTVTGNTSLKGLTATTISATTYLNLPIDVRVTGGTPNNTAHTYTFTNNTGGTFNVIGLVDVFVTGGTYSSGTTTFRNNTGGTFTVTGFTGTDTFVTGFTYNNNNLFTIKQNQGQPDLSVLFNTVSGLTVNGSISGSTFFSGGTNMYNIILSAITENDIYITGASFSGGTLILKRRDGVDFYAPFTGNTSGDCITDLYVSNIYGCSLVTLHNHLIPNIDGSIDLGGELTVTDVNYTGASTTGLTTPWTSTFTGQRFRSINTISGGSTVWTSTYRVNTPNLDLGLDSSGNTRIITADSSVIQDDLLFGGTF